MRKVDRLGWTAGIAFNAYGASVGIRVNDAALMERLPALLVGLTRKQAGVCFDSSHATCGNGFWDQVDRLAPFELAEPWDRGWTKVYETLPYAPFSTELLETVARRLAWAMQVLQPFLAEH